MKNVRESSAPPPLLKWIAALRIMLGVMFLTTWGFNLLEGFYSPAGLLRFFTEIYPQSENPLAFYAAFINGVILPIRGVFAPFQLVAEGLLGLALLIGAFVPLFSLDGRRLTGGSLKRSSWLCRCTAGCRRHQQDNN